MKGLGLRRFVDPDRALAAETPDGTVSALFSRAGLGLRGLRFSGRPEAVFPREKLELIDIFRSEAVGIGISDVIRGADYQTRSLLCT